MVPKFVKIMPIDYKRVLGRSARRAALKEQAQKDMVAPWLIPRAFMKYAREGPKRRPVELRVLDWKEMYEPIPRTSCKLQGARCMDCGVPFCQGDTGCPVVNLIPEWNDLVHRGRWKDALKALHTTNNFPEFTGRLCPAPCEVRVRARHQRGSGVDPRDRMEHHRPRVQRRDGSNRCCRSSETGKTRGDRRVRPGGLGGGAAAGARGPRRHACLKRPIASAACCATGFRISRWKSG